MRTIISKGDRIVNSHELKVQNVQGPMSRCFAISRQILEKIKIERKRRRITC
jgi:hypothetical protein